MIGKSSFYTQDQPHSIKAMDSVQKELVLAQVYIAGPGVKKEIEK